MAAPPSRLLHADPLGFEFEERSRPRGARKAAKRKRTRRREGLEGGLESASETAFVEPQVTVARRAERRARSHCSVVGLVALWLLRSPLQ